MHLSQHTHLPKKLASVRALLGASLLALSPILSWAQIEPSYTTSQNFDPANGGGNLKFTQLGTGGLVVGKSNGNDLPKNNNKYASGSRSFGIENNEDSPATSQIDFRNVQLTSTATSTTTLTFRIAVFAINNTGNSTGGLDSNGSIIVSVNRDSAASSLPTNYRDLLTIRGSGTGSGNYWSFNENFAATSAGLPVAATASYDAPRVYPLVTSQIDTHYSLVSISLNTLSQAKIRITLNASPKTSLLIDDVQIRSSSPLPVELVRFKAEAQEKNVALHWITASEKNSDYFEVQRGTNGETFTAIGKVQGEGTTSSISNYLFTDRTPVAGLAYYRLRQVDLDGTESYSPVQTVEWKGKLTASFYPNPSAESITLTGASGLVHYRIYSVKGQQMADGEAESGSTVNLKTVPAGMYLLELSHGGQRSVQRFVRL